MQEEDDDDRCACRTWARNVAVAVVAVTLSFKPGQKRETNRRSVERLSQPGITQGEEACVGGGNASR